MILYNERLDQLDFIDESIKALAPFRKIISRDKGNTNGGQVRAKKELLFVWYCSDFNSPGVKAGYDNDDFIDKGKIYCGLPKTWEPDQVVAAAINFYRDSLPPEIKYAKDLLEALYTSSKVVGVLGSSLSEQFKYLQELDPKEIEEIEKKGAIVKSIKDDVKTLLDMAGKIPEATRVCRKAVQDANSMNTKTRKIWGQRELGNRESRSRG